MNTDPDASKPRSDIRVGIVKLEGAYLNLTRMVESAYLNLTRMADVSHMGIQGMQLRGAYHTLFEMFNLEVHINPGFT